MTDEQINTEIARILGWGDFSTHSGILFGSMPNPHIEDDRMPVPSYTTDPAAWGVLLVWLAGDREPRGTSLDYWPDEQLWEVTIGAMLDEEITRCRDALPGRALCLAALKAYGVEV